MIVRRLGVRDPAWLAAIVLVVVTIAAIEPFQIPGAPARVPANDWFRWVIQIPGFMVALMLMMFQPQWIFRMWTSPARWVAAFALWQILVAPFGLKPQVNVLLSLGYVAYVGVGVTLVANRGWARIRSYLSVVMMFVVLSSVALWVLGMGNADSGRLEGIMGHPNHLGGACAIAMVLWAYQFRHGQFWTAGLMVVTSGLIVLTDSRTAMIGAALAVAIAMRDLVPRWVLPAGIGAVVVLATLFTQTDVLTERASSISRSGDAEELTTLTNRTVIWDISLVGIGAEPIHGYGPGSSTELFAEITPEDAFGDFEINHAHNLWLQLGLIGGIPSIGFIAFAFGAYALRSGSPRVLERDGIVVAIFVYGITEPVFASEPNVFLLVLAACLASVGAPLAATAEETVSSTAKSRRPNEIEQDPASAETHQGDRREELVETSA